MYSVFSIKSVKKKNVFNQIQKDDQSEKRLNDLKTQEDHQNQLNISDDQLQILWKEFIQKKEMEKEMAIVSYLSNNNPYIQENSIFYKVSSNAVKYALDQIKQELSRFLFQKNREKTLPIVFIVEGIQDEQKRFFTTQEKIEQFVKINPNVRKLIERFKLQF